MRKAREANTKAEDEFAERARSWDKSKDKEKAYIAWLAD